MFASVTRDDYTHAAIKIGLITLMWVGLAATVILANLFGFSWGAEILEMFKSGLDKIPVIAMFGIGIFLIAFTALIAKIGKTKSQYRNAIVGGFVDEIGSVFATFGAVSFLAGQGVVALLVAYVIAFGLAIFAKRLGA
jgi:hypothetical protein